MATRPDRPGLVLFPRWARLIVVLVTLTLVCGCGAGSRGFFKHVGAHEAGRHAGRHIELPETPGASAVLVGLCSAALLLLVWLTSTFILSRFGKWLHKRHEEGPTKAPATQPLGQSAFAAPALKPSEEPGGTGPTCAACFARYQFDGRCCANCGYEAW